MSILSGMKSEFRDVDPEVKISKPSYCGNLSKRYLARIAVVMLLVLVPVLSTFAKNSAYYPPTNLTHYVSIASKMNLNHSAAILEIAPLRPVANVVTVQPIFSRTRKTQPDAPPIQQIGLTVSLQHRSPPANLA